MQNCLINGEIAQCLEASDRGLQYGDGLFETIAVLKGKPAWWQAHINRLSEGCERLGLSMPTQAVLLREVQTVAAGQAKCVVKIILTRGSGGRGYEPPKDSQPNRVISQHPWPEHNIPASGAHLCICKTRLALQPALSGMKHLNRLEQVMARSEWDDPTIYEGLMLNTEDFVISATAANIFLVSASRLLTPRLDRSGVRGVLRGQILEAFQARADQRRITLDMLPEADEVFICNAIRGIIPVTRIDHWEYEYGPVTREVQNWLQTVSGAGQ